MGMLDPKHFNGDEAVTAEVEAGIHQEYAAAMKRAGERKEPAPAEPSSPATDAEIAAAAAQQASLQALGAEAEGWSDLLGGSGALFSKTTAEAEADAPRAEYGGRARVHVVGRLLLLPAGERGAVFLSTEDGASAEVRSRAAACLPLSAPRCRDRVLTQRATCTRAWTCGSATTTIRSCRPGSCWACA
jgi:hypothetical protein